MTQAPPPPPTEPDRPSDQPGAGAPAPPPMPPAPPGGESGGGYAAPPAAQGYGAPPQSGGYASAPPPAQYGGGGQLSQSDERLWAMLSHLGGIVLWFIAPLIVMLTQGEKSPFVRKQAVEALNFQITLTIAYVVCGLLFLVLIGFFLIFVVGIGGLILMILAGIKANNGEDYRYPVNIRMVK